MIVAVAMRNNVIDVSKVREKVIPKGRYATYPVDGATFSHLVELY
jgi:hypothetical protein